MFSIPLLAALCVALALLILLLIVRPRFYFMRDTVRACIQGVGLWVQIGATVFGLAPRWWWNHSDPRQRRNAPRLGLVINAPPEFCGSRARFMVEIGARQIGYRSRGELDRRDSRYGETGWKLFVSLALLIAIGACAPAQVAQVEPALDAACSDAMALAPLAALVPQAAAIVPFVMAGCSTAEGVAKLAADPSSTQWVGQLIGQIKAVLPAKAG